MCDGKILLHKIELFTFIQFIKHFLFRDCFIKFVISFKGSPKSGQQEFLCLMFARLAIFLGNLPFAKSTLV